MSSSGERCILWPAGRSRLVAKTAWYKVPDRADGQVAFERAEDGFDFCKLNVLAPEFGP
jgi:hypothetical protein